MNTQFEIQNLQTLVAFWRYAIVYYEQEIQKAKEIIQQLEDQIDQLKSENDLEDQGF